MDDKITQHQIFRVITAIFIFYLLFVTFNQGILLKKHQVMPGSVDRQRDSIAVAISDLVYHLNKKYVGYRKVQEALENAGVTINQDIVRKLKLPHPETEPNLRSPDLLNAAFAKAASLQDVGSKAIGDLFTLQAEDIGLVDFHKWAFRLYGLKIESFYYFFFTLLTLSTIIFVIANRSPLALSLCALYLLSFFYYVKFAQIPSNETFASGRYIAILAIIPVIHLLFLNIKQQRSRRDWVLASFQLALFIFCYMIRTSVSWIVLALAIPLGYQFFQQGFKVSVLRKFTVIAVLLVSLFSFKILYYNHFFINRYYFTDYYIPQHLFWHNAYIGLTAHPAWKDTFAKNVAHPIGDNLVYDKAIEYLQKTGGTYQDYLTPWGGYRWRLHERLTRHLFLEFVMQHPLFFLETELIWKPLRFVTQMYGYYIVPLWTSFDSQALVLTLIAMMLYVFALGITRIEWQNWLRLSGMTAYAFVLSLLPVFFALSETYLLSDQTLMLTNLIFVVFLGLPWVGLSFIKTIAK